MHNPCVIIPVYNHHQHIEAIAARITGLGLPCILIDDGSDPPCREVLARLARREPAVSLHRLEPNQGKGAAVCAGLRAALAAGYTCALQIDADGQHNIDDIPEFLRLAADNPHDVIAGVRIYRNAPRSRQYGRLLTDLWVWINTLSTDIRDSMCGFRVYPLKPTVEVIDQTPVGRRMDFDTDILVRLYWAGLGVKQLHTRVEYDTGSPSHFDLVADNARISLMHARLFFGMLARAPRLIRRNLSGKVNR
jgi:glycosyltransferase involved in cell wall biosynthesis